jgi:hypothetical protein
MCAKCLVIDDRVKRLRFLSRQTTDELSLDAIAGLVETLEAEKRDLHPEGE